MSRSLGDRGWHRQRPRRGEGLGSTRPRPLIIDCDPGIDDLVALALAARSAEVRLAAVTTTWGNVALEKTTRNARHLLDLAGRDHVPVLPGSLRPLCREAPGDSALHGPEGTGYGLTAPAAPLTERRDDVLRAALTDLDEPVTLVTLGPLTNLARAIQGAEQPLRIGRHLAMAGNFGGGRADFNAWGDPEALDVVLAARLETTLVPLDVTRRTVIPAFAIERCTANADPLTRWLGAALRYYAEAQGRGDGSGGCAVHDVVPVVEAIAPGSLDLGPRRVKIGVGDGPDRGRTTPDPDGWACRVATGADPTQVSRLLGRVLGTGWDRNV